MRILVYILVWSVVLCPIVSIAQSTSINTASTNQLSSDAVSEKSFNFIQKKYPGLANTVDKQTIKLLECMERRENKLRDKLASKDSSKAKELFDGTNAKYRQLQATLQNPVNTNVSNPFKQYIPGINSTSTMMKFLAGNNAILGDKIAQINGVSGQIQKLQGRL